MYTGTDLKIFRENRGWTLSQMSNAVGVSIKTLQVLEKDDKLVGLQLRLALASLQHGLHPIEKSNL